MSAQYEDSRDRPDLPTLATSFRPASSSPQALGCGARLSPRFSLCLIVIAAAFPLSTLVGMYVHYVPVPIQDQWYGSVGWFMRAEDDWWAALFSQHNEHRLVFSQLLYYLDIRFARGLDIINRAANILAAFTMAAGLLACVPRAGRTSGTFAAHIALASTLCFSWLQEVNFDWGFQHQWFIVNTFAAFAFAAIARFGTSGSRPQLLASVALSVCACLTMANGLLALPVTALALLTPCRRLVPFGGLLALSAVEWFWYLHGPGTVTSALPNGTLSYALSHQPMQLLEWTVLYLGTPTFFLFQSRTLAFIQGGALLLACCEQIQHIVVKRKVDQTALTLMLIFIILSAFVTAVGRLPFGVQNVFQERYTTNGLVAVFCAIAARLCREDWRFDGFVSGLVAVPLLSVCVAQSHAFEVDRDNLFQRKLDAIALRVGDTDHDVLSRVSDNDDYLRSILPRARAEHLSILNEALSRIGDKIDLNAAPKCEGNIDVQKLTGTPDIWFAAGWIYDPVSRAVPNSIAFAGNAGVIVGEGLTGRDRPDIGRYYGVSEKAFGWQGYYRSRDRPIRLLGRTADGFCAVP